MSIRERERKEEEGAKRREKQEKAVQELVNRLREELGKNLELNIKPDTFEVTIRDEDGGEKKEVFTRMGGKIFIGEIWHSIERVIEARLRYPEENLSEAIKKLEN